MLKRKHSRRWIAREQEREELLAQIRKSIKNDYGGVVYEDIDRKNRRRPIEGKKCP